MTDPQTAAHNPTLALITKRLQKRYRQERRFRRAGLLAVLFGFVVVLTLIVNISITAWPAFSQNWVLVDIQYRPDWLQLNEDLSAPVKPQVAGQNDPIAAIDIRRLNFRQTLKNSLYEMFPEVTDRSQRQQLFRLLSSHSEFEIAAKVQRDPTVIGTKTQVWLLLDDDVDNLLKASNFDPSDPLSTLQYQVGNDPERLNSRQSDWIKTLIGQQRIQSRWNTGFFTHGDSTEPELAGIKGALSGTFLTLLVTLLLSFPLGLAAALYLEEFAPHNKITDIIEININNLAAVPSIVFGLLGLALVINVFGLPRSSPLVGGIVLSLMTLPTIIIASRAAIKAVPKSIREAAFGLGASNMQVTFGHVLPMAMPGIITGAIIGMAQALGETAPLLMIGMVAFIVDAPNSIGDAATVLPVQIFLWSDSPERGLVAKTSAAILVLLSFLALMNFTAAILRRYFEKQH